MEDYKRKTERPIPGVFLVGGNKVARNLLEIAEKREKYQKMTKKTVKIQDTPPAQISNFHFFLVKT